VRPLLFIARYINHRQPTLRISFRFALFSEVIMAIVPIMDPTAATPLNAEAAANVQAWTEQAAEALQSVSISSQSPRGMCVRLSIPLDPKAPVASSKTPLHDHVRPKTPTQGQVHTSYGRRKLIRRDSLERREALLKGKEGSRQRRRWENGKSRCCAMI
jgi:R3H-associated N-terminal domain